jgi:hypothetical protein
MRFAVPTASRNGNRDAKPVHRAERALRLPRTDEVTTQKEAGQMNVTAVRTSAGLR